MSAILHLLRRTLRPASGFTVGILLALAIPCPARAAEPDYSGLTALLGRYLHVIGSKGQPFDTRFDYEQLYIDQNIWTLKRADGLTTLHTQLLSVSPARMTPRERTAWALNAYNFMVLERMTLHLLVPNRKFMRVDSPRQVSTDQGTFFNAPVTTVDGESFSLSGFERRFVYGDTTRSGIEDVQAARERAGDPRLQFALVRGALCSGPLLPWVYRADSLDAQLDRATRLALATRGWLRLDAATGTLSASNRFFDERADFGGPEMPGLMPFLNKFAPPAARKVILARKLARPDMFFEADWKLNQYDQPRPALPGADSTRTIRKL